MESKDIRNCMGKRIQVRGLCLFAGGCAAFSCSNMQMVDSKLCLECFPVKLLNFPVFLFRLFLF